MLLDVMMPRLSGYEVCRALREKHPIGELPVLFLTAKTQDSDLVAGLAVGGSDYLAKPIAKDELLARVRTHLALLSVHRQLTRVVDDLETKNADLAQFNYAVAHDLKNPLTTIMNFLGLARLDAASGRAERLEHDLDRLDAAAQKLRLLLDELFELSRVGVQGNPPEEVAFGELVREALAQLAGQVAERGVEVEVAPDLPVVNGDRARLLEVVRHLLGNAVQYLGDQPAPRIEVGVRAAAAPDGEPPVFFVRDNGMGIDPKYHEKVFGLFDRLDPEASEGTGIGLTLVRRIAEVHGGKVWVESAGLGEGSTFCLSLPVAR
ncbi:MAG: response regulator [Actinomycetia bacterium]|nr:response regulator [Actinomycetes bacterium]